VVGEQPRGLGPVAGRLQVTDGVGGLGVLGVPARGDAVQLRDLPGVRAA
jgi:hypothetical protein